MSDSASLPGSHGGRRPGAGAKPGNRNAEGRRQTTQQPPRRRGFWKDERERHRYLDEHPELRDRGWSIGSDSVARIGEVAIVHSHATLGAIPHHVVVTPNGATYATENAADAFTVAETLHRRLLDRPTPATRRPRPATTATLNPFTRPPARPTSADLADDLED